jgi:hypothetical protein
MFWRTTQLSDLGHGGCHHALLDRVRGRHRVHLTPGLTGHHPVSAAPLMTTGQLPIASICSVRSRFRATYRYRDGWKVEAEGGMQIVQQGVNQASAWTVSLEATEPWVDGQLRCEAELDRGVSAVGRSSRRCLTREFRAQ